MDLKRMPKQELCEGLTFFKHQNEVFRKCYIYALYWPKVQTVVKKIRIGLRLLQNLCKWLFYQWNASAKCLLKWYHINFTLKLQSSLRDCWLILHHVKNVSLHVWNHNFTVNLHQMELISVPRVRLCTYEIDILEDKSLAALKMTHPIFIISSSFKTKHLDIYEVQIERKTVFQTPVQV